MSALDAIRTKCLDCCLGSRKEVERCTCKICMLYALRLGKCKEPLKAIREYCLGCGEAGWKAVKNCEHATCPLYSYRLGKNQNRRMLTLDERKAKAKNLAKARKTKCTARAP